MAVTSVLSLNRCKFIVLMAAKVVTIFEIEFKYRPFAEHFLMVLKAKVPE